MLRIWDTISHIGTEEVSLASDRRNIIMSNQIATIAFVLIFVLFYTQLTKVGWTYLTYAMLFGNLVSYPTILLLNRFGLSTFSRIYLSLMLSTYPFISTLKTKLSDIPSIEEPMYFSPRLFIMVAGIIPLLLFSSKEWKLLLLGLCGSLLPILFFDTIHDLFGVGYYQVGFSATRYPTLVTISNVSYLLFVTSMFFFKRMNERYESQNLTLIASLRKKNEEVALQAKEIELINKNLTDVVDNRTKKLLDQALRFQKFAFKNSHELRAPLAKVLSTLSLLKNPVSQEEREQLLKVLNQSCIELDQIVHEINGIISSEVDLESR